MLNRRIRLNQNSFTLKNYITNIFAWTIYILIAFIVFMLSYYLSRNYVSYPEFITKNMDTVVNTIKNTSETKLGIDLDKYL